MICDGTQTTAAYTAPKNRPFVPLGRYARASGKSPVLSCHLSYSFLSKIVEGFDAEQRRTLLRFVTASGDRPFCPRSFPPYMMTRGSYADCPSRCRAYVRYLFDGGFSGLVPKFCIRDAGRDVNLLKVQCQCLELSRTFPPLKPRSSLANNAAPRNSCKQFSLVLGSIFPEENQRRFGRPRCPPFYSVNRLLWASGRCSPRLLRRRICR